VARTATAAAKPTRASRDAQTARMDLLRIEPQALRQPTNTTEATEGVGLLQRLAQPQLTQAAYWQAIQGYIRAGDVLIADPSTSYGALGLQLSPNCTVASQVIWGSISYGSAPCSARGSRRRGAVTCCLWATPRSR
jgi:TPP-dependent 2-oxoacid decarboxylase